MNKKWTDIEGRYIRDQSKNSKKKNDLQQKFQTVVKNKLQNNKINIPHIGANFIKENPHLLI